MEPDELIPTRWSLIKRLKNWDDEASWRDFFDTYWKLIYGVAVKSGLTHDEAEEAVQTTVVSVCRVIKEFKADPAHGSFKGWLLKLTRWRIEDQRRKRSGAALRRIHLAKGERGAGERATATEEAMADPAGDDFEAIWNEEWEKNLVEAALERVKMEVATTHFQMFYLSVIKEYPARQVAKVTGASVDQVYLVKHRVSKLFKTAVEELSKKMN